MNASFTIYIYIFLKFFLAQRKIISLQKGGEKKTQPKGQQKKNHTHNQKAMNQLEPILNGFTLVSILNKTY
jgi:hypothetical protein